MTGSALVELEVSSPQIADIRTPRTVINKKTFKQKVKATQVKSSVKSFSRLKLVILIQLHDYCILDFLNQVIANWQEV